MKHTSAEIPNVRIGFTRVRRLRREILGIPDSKRDPGSIYVSVYGVPAIPTAVLTFAGSPVLDYEYSREDLLWHSTSHNYTFDCRIPHKGGDFPKDLTFQCGSETLVASQSEFFDPEFPFYESPTFPNKVVNGTPVTEKDMRWIIFKPAIPKDSAPPKIGIGTPYAQMASFSDHAGHWAGTIIAFTPDIHDAKLSLDGHPIKDRDKPLQIVHIG